MVVGIGETKILPALKKFLCAGTCICIHLYKLHIYYFAIVMFFKQLQWKSSNFIIRGDVSLLLDLLLNSASSTTVSWNLCFLRPLIFFFKLDHIYLRIYWKKVQLAVTQLIDFSEENNEFRLSYTWKPKCVQKSDI